MSDLTEEAVLLIVCKAINPFVDVTLLTRDSGGRLVPVEGAMHIKIGKSLKTLAADDQAHGSHNIAFIRAQILMEIQNRGFATALSPAQMIDGQSFPTIQHLVDALLAQAVEL